MKISPRLTKYWISVILPSTVLALIAADGDGTSFVLVFALSGIFLGYFAYMLWISKEKEYNLSFSLEHGGAKRLNLIWKGSYKNIVILVDGAWAGGLDQLDKHNQGKIPLYSGSEITLKPGTHPFYLLKQHPELRIDGIPVPGSLGDPVFELESASLGFGVSGVTALFFGFFHLNQGMPLDFMVNLFIFMAAIACALFVRRRIRAGLWLGGFLFAAELLVLVFMLAAASGAGLIEPGGDFLSTLFAGIGFKNSYGALKKQQGTPPTSLDQSFLVK
jgi:hypothetical protein